VTLSLISELWFRSFYGHAPKNIPKKRKKPENSKREEEVKVKGEVIPVLN
jgi:hypothetical protein